MVGGNREGVDVSPVVPVSTVEGLHVLPPDRPLPRKTFKVDESSRSLVPDVRSFCLRTPVPKTLSATYDVSSVSSL